jgi:flagellar transcriptional activator FlhC
MLGSELTRLRDRMIRVCREVRGASPPKGTVPFSADRYIKRVPNIRASLSYKTYVFLKTEVGCSNLMR